MEQKKIDKGIPISKLNRGKSTKYPWATMEIGDSFLLDAKNGSNTTISGKRYGRVFTQRTTTEGIRVWRVK